MADYRRLWRLALGRAKDAEREVDDEIRAHFEMRVEELIAGGASEEEARAEATRRFGDLSSARAELRRAARRRERRRNRRDRVGDLVRDLGLALRRARRSPGYAVFSASVFALAIGLTTSVFTVVDHVLFRPLPFPDANALVVMKGVDGEGTTVETVSMGNWYDWREGSTGIANTALYNSFPGPLLLGSEPVRSEIATVRGAFFETLRPRMLLGRGITEAEGQAGTPVTVVSASFWNEYLGAGPMSGFPRLEIEGSTYDIVGVVAAEAALPSAAEVWLSQAPRPESGAVRNNINWTAVARVAAGATLPSLEIELSGIARGIMESDPEAVYSHGVHVEPLVSHLTGRSKQQLMVLLAGVVLVLLTACVNLAALSLARLRRRSGDVSVQLALGASKTRVVQSLLADNLVLAFVGGATGAALAWVALDWVVARLSVQLPRIHEIGFDPRVLGFALVVTVAAAILTSAPSIMFVSRSESRRLAKGGRGTARGGRRLPGGALVAVEAALAVSLLVSGGLLARSFLTLANRDLGYRPAGLLTFDVGLGRPDYTEAAEAADFWTRLLESIEEQPSVAAAAAGNWIPTGGGGGSFIELPGDPNAGGAGYRVVSDGYFETMGIPLLTGRSFSRQDQFGTQRVALVNESYQKRFWPNQSPIGTQVKPVSMERWMFEGDPPWVTVIGVVGDVLHWGFEDEAAPEIFVLYRQVPEWARSMTAVVKPRARAGLTPDAVEARIKAIDPGVAFSSRSFSERLRPLLAQRRAVLALLAIFGVATVLLVALGVYGLITFAAAERSREIAIRLTLGAQRNAMVGELVSSALRTVTIGVAIGLAGAYAISRGLEALLVDVTRADPATYTMAATLVVLIGAAGAWIPSHRASRLDPAASLRSD